MSGDGMDAPPKFGGEPTSGEKSWALLAHLSPLITTAIVLPFVGPLVIWLMYKDKSAFVGDQAKEALNFQLTLLIAYVACGATIVGIVLIPVIYVVALVLQIIACIEASKGVWYRFPLTLRLIS